MTRPEPPADLDEAVVGVWRAVVAAHQRPEAIAPARLEAYCRQVAMLRSAHERVVEQGLVVEDPAGRMVPNPAVRIAEDLAQGLRRWGQEFSPARPARRRTGPMYDATCEAITNAAHLKARRDFAGVVAAVKTLAWLIDEAQRAGIEELQKTAFGTIPTYLRACEALQITPASQPAADPGKVKGPSRLQALRGGMASGSSASAG